MIQRDRRKTWWSLAVGLAVVASLVGAGWMAWHRYWSSNRAPVPAPERDELAVLVPPFRVIGQADRLRLSVGLASAVEGALRTLPGLVVRPWALQVPSGVFLAATEAPADHAAAVEVARRIGTAYVLVGDVDTQHPRTEIAVRLLHVRDGTPAWSGTYWRDQSALAAFPSELALAVAEVMQLPPSAFFSAMLDLMHQPDGEAYGWYLEGLSWRAHGTPSGVGQAADRFRRATKSDPTMASAWAALAEALAYLAESEGELPRNAIAEWRAAAERAVALDSLNGEAFLRRAVVRFRLDRDSTNAMVDFARALRLLPADPGAHLAYARFLDRIDRRDSALAHIQRALGRDSRYGEVRRQLLGGKNR